MPLPPSCLTVLLLWVVANMLLPEHAEAAMCRAEDRRIEWAEYVELVREEMQAEHDAYEAAQPEDERLARPLVITWDQAVQESRRRMES